MKITSYTVVIATIQVKQVAYTLVYKAQYHQITNMYCMSDPQLSCD